MYQPLYCKVIIFLTIRMYLKTSHGKYKSYLHYFVKGAYTPLTMDCNIIVDSILASCYAYFDHDVANIGMTPMQWYPEVMDWIIGKDKESPGYVNLLSDVDKLVNDFLFLSKIH